MLTYTVIQGDTMWSISQKYGVTLNDLIEANPQITNPNLIFPGQMLNVPNSNKLKYSVLPGDTMWTIAEKHGISLNDLVEANPQIVNPSFILPGQNINVPSFNNTTSDLTNLENEVVRLVNIERAKVGQSALTSNKEVSRVARIKSEDFVKNDYFSHNSPKYGTPFEMLRSFGISFSAAAENNARGQKSASEVMNSWMNSSGHRTNILNSDYNQIGVGVARDKNGELFWTQMFIRA